MMPFSAEAVAIKLLGASPAAMTPVSGGGNNRMYRLTDAGGHDYALKSYPRQAGDPRDRLGTEFAALSFLAANDVSVVPRPLSRDDASGFALYEWIEGSSVGTPSEGDIEAVLAFAALLRRLSASHEACDLPAASEACFSGQEIVCQIQRRRHRLDEVAAAEAGLAAFLETEFAPVLMQAVETAHAGYKALGWSFEQALAYEQLALSPSDFGFHNAIRRTDGSLAFIDFEYFGWDDPVRLTADFLQHPGMSLDEAASRRFRQGALSCYSADAGFSKRLDLLFPLVGLRWCMILLNEFLPERWFRREFSGMHSDRQAVVEQQLSKARARLTAVAAVLKQQR